MASFNIPEVNVTVVTTDTAANQKNVITKYTHMDWLLCMCHVLELVMGVSMKGFSQVLD